MSVTSSPTAQRCATLLWPLLVLLKLAAPAHAEKVASKNAGKVTIKTIEVEDNTKTTDDTVILIAGVEVGDEFSSDMVSQIRADLVNSGLFKAVEVTHAPVPGGMLLTISARDKHSWIIAPTYYDQPTNRGAGLGFGENNLFGKNEKLLLYAQYATGDSFFIGAYVDPSIAGSRFKWQADVYLLRARAIEYAPPQRFLEKPREVRIAKLNYLNAGVKGGVNLFRGASLDLRLRGAKVFYDNVGLADGAAVGDVTDDPTATPATIPAPGAEGYDVSGEVIIEYDRRANWYGISHGDRYRVSFEHALPGLGSDFDYWLARLTFQRARRYFTSHNLIIKSTVSFGQNLPFQQELTAGGTDLRGYRNEQFRGDFRAAASVEYSLSLFNIKGVALRTLGFFDSAYTAFLDVEDTDTFRSYLPGHGDVGATPFAPFKNTIGVGTRIYIRQIVLPLLGLDLGYGLERGDYEIFFAVGLTDL